MKHDITDGLDGRKALHIAADWSEVAADYDDLLVEYGKAAVPGFRTGKVPRQIIERRYQRQLRDDFAARSGQRLARQALRERRCRAAGPIAVVEIHFEPGREFSFTAECVLLPRLDLPDYTAVPLAGVTEEARRDELTVWLLERTVWDPPEALVREESERSEPSGVGPGGAEWEAAAKRVKLMLILEQIAEAEGIEVDARDVDDRIARMAIKSEVRPAALRRQLGENGVGRLQLLLRAEQTLAFLLARTPRADTGT